jgi:Zn-dependent protease
VHDNLNIGIRIFVWAVPVMYAITLHEVAHGAVAYYLGDATAKRAGRLSLNPLKHVDLVGSITIPVLLLWFSGFIFGWAKPVPVNEKNLNFPKRDMVLVAAAGPVANFIMSIIWAIIMKLGYMLSATQPDSGLILVYMGAAGIFINAAVMILNLLPLPPLDGGRILTGLLPERTSQMLSKVEPWGLMILVIMIITGLVAKIVWPMIVVQMTVVTHLVDTPAELFINALRVLLGESDLSQ